MGIPAPRRLHGLLRRVVRNVPNGLWRFISPVPGFPNSSESGGREPGIELYALIIESLSPEEVLQQGHWHNVSGGRAVRADEGKLREGAIIHGTAPTAAAHRG